MEVKDLILKLEYYKSLNRDKIEIDIIMKDLKEIDGK